MALDNYLSNTGLSTLWNLITSKRNGKADSSHTHTKSDISDFPTSLKDPYALTVQFNGATAKTYNGASAQTVNVSPANIGAAEEGHTHALADVDGLQTALNAKAASSHTHAISDVTNLQTTLDGKASSSHTHTVQATNISVATSAWASSTTYSNYPFQATITVSGVTSSMIPEVIFGLTEAESGNFAPIAASTTNGVIIYAKTQPTASITIPAVICHK